MDDEAHVSTAKEPRRHPTMMMSVASMLNPVEDQQILSPTPTCPGKMEVEPVTQLLKKPKLAKDAPIFVEGSPTGHVRFPPYDKFCESDREEMAKFDIYPALEDIGTFPRHIPYSSDKKDFLLKTGREAFEVFQYTFKVPTDERTHTVMWDYNIGLVRITPFFKCRRFAKTVPGKMLASNPGLKSVCHSITGGALAAQGYWMPYSAARALAATFCYQMRHALLPLFGHEFAAECLHPRDSGYQEMIIDRKIVENCIQEAALMRCEMATSAQKAKDFNQNSYRAFTPTPTATEESLSIPGTPLTSHATFEKPFMSSVEQNSLDTIEGSRSGTNIQRGISPAVSQSSIRGRRHGFAALSSSSSDTYPPKSDRWQIPRSHEPSHLLEARVTPGAHVSPSSPALHSPLECYSIDGWRSSSDSSDGTPLESRFLPRLPCLCDEYNTNRRNAKTSPTSSCLRKVLVGSRDEHLAAHSSEPIPTRCEPSEEELRAAWVLWQIHLAESGNQIQSVARRDLTEKHGDEQQLVNFERISEGIWALSSSSSKCQEMGMARGRKRRAST